MERIFIQYRTDKPQGMEEQLEGPFYPATEAQYERACEQIDADEHQVEAIVTESDVRGGFWVLAWHYISPEEV